MKKRRGDFVHITTGQYTYNRADGYQEVSHSLYGLDEYGEVFKWIPMKKIWVHIEDLDID